VPDKLCLAIKQAESQAIVNIHSVVAHSCNY